MRAQKPPTKYNCAFCGCAAERPSWIYQTTCDECQHQHYMDARTARVEVRKAVVRGDMPRARDCICVDCGKSATGYDHRDYLKPLDVQPVCHACNAKRGPALNSTYRGAIAAQEA